MVKLYSTYYKFVLSKFKVSTEEDSIKTQKLEQRITEHKIKQGSDSVYVPFQLYNAFGHWLDTVLVVSMLVVCFHLVEENRWMPYITVNLRSISLQGVEKPSLFQIQPVYFRTTKEKSQITPFSYKYWKVVF